MGKWGAVIRAAAITFGGGLLFAFLGGVMAGYAASSGWVDGDLAELIVTAIFAVAIMIGALWIGAEWMRVIDEAAREAHKAAWYWGGTAGMCVSGVALILSSAGPWRDVIARHVGSGAAPIDYLSAGAALMIAPMLIGYVVVWAWWWLARMRA
ncbi:MAG: hypothetical protein DI624_07520 [Brevundimonas sp.]|uniref:hypothetical protein n=1 Tax=Brevundimonas sp. TaxID=1871086 RepID=UPI000DB3037C|nr:hypothetical protein [Brevundimonas sp.]PZT98644.1 MAG: hypothetical protein DI624_07520 [Brevundimonas sp.]